MISNIELMGAGVAKHWRPGRYTEERLENALTAAEGAHQISIEKFWREVNWDGPKPGAVKYPSVILAEITKAIGKEGRHAVFLIGHIIRKSNTVLGLLLKWFYSYAQGGIVQAFKDSIFDTTGVLIGKKLSDTLVAVPYPHLPDSGLPKYEIELFRNSRPSAAEALKSMLLFEKMKGSEELKDMAELLSQAQTKDYHFLYNVTAETDLMQVVIYACWFVVKYNFFGAGQMPGPWAIDEIIRQAGAFISYSIFEQFVVAIEEDIPIIGGLIYFLVDDFLQDVTGEIRYV